MNRFSGRNILLVENNAHMRAVLATVLGAFGAARVLETDNALAGYLLACTEPVDLVLLDFFLGEHDGADFVRLLRGDAACIGRDAPVVVVTALPRHPRVAAALASGADGVLAKPISPRTLYETLNPILAERRSAPSALPAHADTVDAPAMLSVSVASRF